MFGTYIGAVFGLLSVLTFFGILFSVFTWGGDYYDDYDWVAKVVAGLMPSLTFYVT